MQTKQKSQKQRSATVRKRRSEEAKTIKKAENQKSGETERRRSKEAERWTGREAKKHQSREAWKIRKEKSKEAEKLRSGETEIKQHAQNEKKKNSNPFQEHDTFYYCLTMYIPWALLQNAANSKENGQKAYQQKETQNGRTWFPKQFIHHQRPTDFQLLLWFWHILATTITTITTITYPLSHTDDVYFRTWRCGRWKVATSVASWDESTAKVLRCWTTAQPPCPWLSRREGCIQSNAKEEDGGEICSLIYCDMTSMCWFRCPKKLNQCHV